jgi:hypothetical protein
MWRDDPREQIVELRTILADVRDENLNLREQVGDLARKAQELAERVKNPLPLIVAGCLLSWRTEVEPTETRRPSG